MLNLMALGLQSISLLFRLVFFSLAMDLMLAFQLQISESGGLSLNVTQQFMNT